jgi:hypothetical protein
MAVALRCFEQCRDHFRRMLQVAVHHDDPLCARCRLPGQHGSAESAPALARWAVKQVHGQRSPVGHTHHNLWRVIIAVVDEQHVCVVVGKRHAQATDERHDVRGLVACRYDNAHFGVPRLGAPVCAPYGKAIRIRIGYRYLIGAA